MGDIGIDFLSALGEKRVRRVAKRATRINDVIDKNAGAAAPAFLSMTSLILVARFATRRTRFSPRALRKSMPISPMACFQVVRWRVLRRQSSKNW